MKKIILILGLFLFANAAFASNVVVESLTDVSGENSTGDFSVKVLEQAELTEGIIVDENAIINGKIIKKVEAKRGKRNAYIVICPISYTNGAGDVVTLIENSDLEAKVVGYSKKDLKKMGLDAGLAVGGHFIKGMGQIFYFSKGLIVPDKDKGRIETAAHNVYENSPFVYIEKGQDVGIEKGDYLVLKFYHSDVPKWRPIKRKK